MKIGIVGAGPAGLVASLAGCRLGFDVYLFDKFSEFKKVGSGIGLHSNGFRVLESLGLLGEIKENLHICRRYILKLLRSATFVNNLEDTRVPHGYFAVIMRYELLEKLLRKALDEGVKFFPGYKCVDLEVHGEKVILKFENGGIFEFDIVLACDGKDSLLRDKAGSGFKHVRVSQAYLRGISEFGTGGEDVIEIWGNDGRLFGYCPLKENKTYFYCTAPLEGFYYSDFKKLNEWISFWKEYGEPVEILKGVRNWEVVNYDSKIGEIYMKKWYSERVFFLGDSAHAMRPNYGQGANSAMVDALVLIKLLKEYTTGNMSLEEVGNTYQSIRKPFVSRIQRGARLAGIMSSFHSPLKIMLRNTLMRITQSITPIRRDGLITGMGYNPEEDKFFGRI